jgi:hypothetical protein
MTRKEKQDKITRLCDRAECSAKMRKLHFDQFVYRDWHPHPPQSFIDWFARHPDNIGEGGSGPVAFFNCQRYYDQFCEARMRGLLDETPKSLQQEPAVIAQQPEDDALPF